MNILAEEYETINKMLAEQKEQLLEKRIQRDMEITCSERATVMNWIAGRIVPPRKKMEALAKDRGIEFEKFAKSFE